MIRDQFILDVHPEIIIDKPREKKIRGLAWIVLRYAALARPRVIMLENVEEFKTWGSLLKDGQPCSKRKGNTFRSFIHQLQEKGYAIEAGKGTLLA